MSSSRSRFDQLQNDLKKVRGSRPPEPATTLDDAQTDSPAQTTQVEDTDSQIDPPWWWRLLNGSWRVQMAFTLLLWASLMNVGFGAVFFVVACIYWLCVWGTETHRRQQRPRAQDTILAGWYFDNTRIM